jgi:ribosomal protein S18 acetylase RimI-like enzyme
MFPNATRRMATSEWMFRRLLKSKIAQGLVRVIRDDNQQVASAAVWTEPHPPAPTRWEHYSESLFMRWVHGKRIHEIRDGFTALAARHPRVPYWYLQALATSPAQRGQGHAARLLQEQFSLSSASGELIALETSNPANLPYYQKFGFEVADELVLQEQFPVWLMCRNAGLSATSSD